MAHLHSMRKTPSSIPGNARKQVTKNEASPTRWLSRHRRLPSKPGSLSLSDPCDPCEGGEKTWLSSDLYMAGTQELEADWSAGRGYITGGATLSCSLGREGPLPCVLGWVSALQVSAYSSIKYQVIACQQPAQLASSKSTRPLLPAAGSESREGAPKE